MGILAISAPAKRVAGPALQAFPEVPVLTGGYLGTVTLPFDVIEAARSIGEARRNYAENGSYRTRAADQFALADDVKGAAGELVVRHALSALESRGAARFSALVAERPDHQADVKLALPLEFADLLNPLNIEVKTYCGALAGFQTRADGYFLHCARQLENYIAEGLDGILFVYLDNRHTAHICYASCRYIKANWTLAEKGSRLAPREASYVRPVAGVIPS